MVSLLKDIVIEEVSSVDAAANPHARVLLAKRHATKGDQTMSSTIILKNAQHVVEYGGPPAFQRSDYIRELYKRADEIRADGETVAKARTRAMCEDQAGRMLWKASRNASGPEIETDAPQDDVKPKAFADFGDAHRRIEMMARDHKIGHPAKSMEQCRAAVYTAPENADLRRQAMSEHFDQMQRGSLSRTDAPRVDDEHDAPDLARAAQRRDQSASDDFAADQARRYPGGRDVKGPKPLDEKKRLVKVIDGALAALVG